ncbi:MAG: phosphoglucomutase/phosphomannomutase family protein [Bacteroidia bacterium]|nr:phosphoglucomutase/phosphomannomutase family protein [Bacteroidia bacterium]
MTTIKFGTDGWRAIIAKEFTADNVARAAQGYATWLKENYKNPSMVVGHDCRFAGELFVHSVIQVMLLNNIKVYASKGFVSTPMVSLGCKSYSASGGVIITASHNPPEYSGFKLKSGHGGPLLEQDVKAVEKLIPTEAPAQYQEQDLEKAEKEGRLVYVALENDYVKRVEEGFDLDAIRNSKFNFAYDAMYGAGQNVMRRLFSDITLVHCDHNPLFDGIAPEPIMKNLQEFSDIIKVAEDIDCGLVTDGDADRIGLFSGKGEFVDSHHILLLLTHYLYKYKGWTGKVATGFSTTVKLEMLCKHYGLDFQVVPIGFKHVCGIMLKEDVLVGGEESGGIAVKGHIPERDGIWNGMLIWEMMVKTGKSLTELIQEIYDIVGSFAFRREDLGLLESKKQEIIANCKAGKYESFGGKKPIRMEDMDGWKFYFSDSEWLMIRPSGTEPVLRIYAEASTAQAAQHLLDLCKSEIL